MKGDRVGEFEELVLLSLQAIVDQAYGVSIQQYIEKTTRRKVSMGAVYATLDRLEHKGLVKSEMGEATPMRGGRPKRLFTVTPLGKRTLQDVRRVRDALWRAIEESR